MNKYYKIRKKVFKVVFTAISNDFSCGDIYYTKICKIVRFGHKMGMHFFL